MTDPSSVYVQFFGICTHISADALVPPATGWNHRVVLVNASHPHELGVPRLRDLEPHLATLQLAEYDILRSPAESTLQQASGRDDVPLRIQPLDGVTMTIVNAVPSPGAATPSSCIPALSSFIRHDGAPLGRASLHAYEKNPARTACFFDFSAVTPVTGVRYGEAAVGVLQVFTSGNPLLRITPFDDDLAGITIELRSGAHISVCNLPKLDTKDDIDDFLFHYLIVDPFPKDLDWPPKTFGVPCPARELPNGPLSIQQITTAGCSNTVYP